MGEVTAAVNLANNADLVLARDKVRTVEWRGVVDTRATHLVLPESVAARLGLTPRGTVKTVRPDGRTVLRARVLDVCLSLLGRADIFSAVIDPDRDDVRIGRIVLDSLDLLVDRATRTLYPRDPTGIISEAE